jgi:hypothetical protein
MSSNVPGVVAPQSYEPNTQRQRNPTLKFNLAGEFSNAGSIEREERIRLSQKSCDLVEN